MQVHPQITTNSVFYTSNVIVLTSFNLEKNRNPVLQGYTDRPEQNKLTTNICKYSMLSMQSRQSCRQEGMGLIERGWAGEGEWDFLFRGYIEFQFSKVKRILGMEGGDAHKCESTMGH